MFNQHNTETKVTLAIMLSLLVAFVATLVA
jgi:hypothetical protein